MSMLPLTVIQMVPEAMVASSMTSEFILDIRFEISNLSYPQTYAHVIH